MGYYNHRWFLLFLLTTCALATYAAIVIYLIFRGEIERQNLLQMQWEDPGTHIKYKITWGLAYLIMLNEYTPLGALGAFSACVAGIVALFLSYHLYLVGKGTTTNESFKWEDYLDALTQEAVEKAKREAEEEEQQADTKGKDDGGKKQEQQQQTKKKPKIKVYVPRNIYDKGVWGNFKEVMFPRAPRHQNVE